MSRRTLRVVVDRLLVVAVVTVVATGVIVDQLDLNEFRPHSWAGYAMAALTAIHVGLAHRRGARGTGAGSAATFERKPAGAEDGPVVAAGSEAANGRGVSRRGVLASLAAATGGAALGWFARVETSTAVPDGDVGLFYHQESSLGIRGIVDALLNWGARPDRYKLSIEAGAIDLPQAAALPEMTLAEALDRRRSLRDYANRSLTSEELAWVVGAMTGITHDDGRRTAPSAGALYPIETYVAVDRVDGVDPGLYHVDVRRQALEPIRTGSVAGDVMIAGLGQGFLQEAPIVVILTGLFQRSRWKYRQRHYRYVVWEAGHVAQNAYLAAEAAGLGACVVGAFLDRTLNALLGLDGREEAALGLIAVGPR